MFLAKNLRYLRLKYNYSQQDIADMVGFKSFVTIQKWETGLSQPRLESLDILSKLFGYSMDDLYRRDLHGDSMYKEITDFVENEIKSHPRYISRIK